MQANNQIGSFDEILDAKYGKIGSKQREDFHKEAYAYCVGEMIKDARKQEHVTQEALAELVGTNKSYISSIEKGLVEPGAGLFLRIMGALGLRVDIVRPV